MTSGTIMMNGIVHGKTIELIEDSGLREGQPVKVMLRLALAPGEGLQRAFGSWADGANQLDQFVAQIYRDREDDRTGPTP
jgi:hypothetical protein